MGISDFNLTPDQRANTRRKILAYRIWAHCEPIGWDCTRHECAGALNVHVNAVAKVAIAEGWGTRFRSGKLDTDIQRRTPVGEAAPQSVRDLLAGQDHGFDGVSAHE